MDFILVHYTGKILGLGVRDAEKERERPPYPKDGMARFTYRIPGFHSEERKPKGQCLHELFIVFLFCFAALPRGPKLDETGLSLGSS